MLVCQILDRAVRRVPQKIGLISGNRSYTFRQMRDRVNRLANAFLDIGLVKGYKVATLLPSTPEFYETFFATAKVGLVFVPVNYNYLADELIYAINHVEASILVVDERYLDKVETIRPRLPSVMHYITVGESTTTNYEQMIARYPPDSPKVNITYEDLAVILYTSGTTARAKGVMHTHRSIYAFVLACGPLLHIQSEKDVCLVTSPSYHIAAAFKVVATTYYLDTAIIMEYFNPKSFLRAIQEYKVTNVFSPLVPTMLIRLLDDRDFGKYDISSLRSVFIGVNIIPYPLVKRAIEAFGPKVFNLYGTTEGGGVLTLMEPGEMRLDLPPEKVRICESCGREPTRLIGEIRVVNNDTGKEVVPDEIGEIVLRGDGVMEGYWGMPEETAKVIDRDGWYHSGDLATVDEDGYIYIKGRMSDIIRSGGENISPVEIEEIIRRHPAVNEVAVIGVPDEYWGEAVKAVVVLKEKEKASEEEIIWFCRQHLASFKKPRSVDFVDELPTVSSGMMRVSRAQLRKKYDKTTR